MKYLGVLIMWVLFPVAILSYVWCIVCALWQMGQDAFMKIHATKGS